MKNYLKTRPSFGLMITTIILLTTFILAACDEAATSSGIPPTNPAPVQPGGGGAKSVATTPNSSRSIITTLAPVVPPTLQLAKAVSDTITAPPLGLAEASLKATGFNADEAKQLLDDFTNPQTIGTRVIGSDGEKKAADWLERHYKSYGYTQVERQQFPFNAPDIRRGTVFLGDPADSKNVKASGILLSKPQKAQIQAQTIFYTSGTDIKGKIVVVTTGGDYASVKPVVDTVAKGGGVAVLIPRISLLPDFKTFGDVDIPVVVVSFNNLPDLQPSPTGEKMTLQTSYTPGGNGNGQNIIATRPGPKPDAPILIFGGHYDSVASSLAANGNASGTVVTLELAKVLFNKFPSYELRFINFSGTESGLAGSNYYVSKLSADDKKRIAGYIDLNLVGVGDSFIAAGTKELVDTAIGVAGQNNLKLEAIDPAPSGFSSDYQIFVGNGLKALFLARWQDSQYRKAGDTPDRVFSAALLITGGTAIFIAQKIVGS